MEIKYEEISIIMIPENYRDALYLAYFAKRSNENGLGNFELQTDTGYCDPELVVAINDWETIENKNEDPVLLNDITSLIIYNMTL